LEKLARLKSNRDNARVLACLKVLRGAATNSENTMPAILDAVRAYATVGEICDTLREVFGAYTETSVL
jgi:methylmalonyl-CoA mutase N-terminal domain/subunit